MTNLFNSGLSELQKVLFLMPSVCDIFVCVKYLSGIAERICAKFTWKTCLVPRLGKFEGQRSRSPGTKTAFLALSAVCLVYVW